MRYKNPTHDMEYETPTENIFQKEKEKWDSSQAGIES